MPPERCLMYFSVGMTGDSADHNAVQSTAKHYGRRWGEGEKQFSAAALNGLMNQVTMDKRGAVKRPGHAAWRHHLMLSSQETYTR